MVQLEEFNKLKENRISDQQQEKENEVHVKAVLEKLQGVPIKGLKSVFLGVKNHQIRLVSNTENSIFHPYNLDTFL